MSGRLGVPLGVDLGAESATTTALALERISAPAHNAYSIYRKLRGAYTGPALRVRRSSDDAELDIGFADELVDVAALLAFVAGASGFVSWLYDHGIFARHLSQLTPAAQPRIVNAGVLDTYPSGKPAMSFDGVDDNLFRSVPNDTIGLSGNPNFTAAIVQQGSGLDKLVFAFGRAGNTNGSGFAISRRGPGLSTFYTSFFGTQRNYTPLVNPDAQACSYVMEHRTATNSISTSVRENGVNLVQGTSQGTVITPALLDQNLELGGPIAFPTRGFSGKISTFMLFGEVLSDALSDQAALDAELGAHA